MVPVRYGHGPLIQVLNGRSVGRSVTPDSDYHNTAFILSIFLFLSTLIMLLARRALFLARHKSPLAINTKLIHSVAQTDRVLFFPNFIILFLYLFFFTGNNHTSFVLHWN